MGRLKAVYRSQAIASTGWKLYGRRQREQWLVRLGEGGARRGAELLYQELDGLQGLRLQARRELILASNKQAAARRLRTIPFLGPIRAALLLGKVQTPDSFRTKRQFWTYCGLGRRRAAAPTTVGWTGKSCGAASRFSSAA